MIRKLTFEGRFECGIDALVKGKAYAFVVVTTNGDYAPWGLGVAVANEPGYYPIPAHWAHGDDYKELDAHAEELNAELGVGPRAAAIMVASSMRQKVGA